MSKRVLVLGGSYFIGKAIISTLLYYNYDVTMLNRGHEVNLFNGVRNLIADRNDETQMMEVLENEVFDIVIDISGMNRTHVKYVLKALDLSDLKKYLFISSSAVYDLNECNLPIKESSPKVILNAENEYGFNKHDAENYLIAQFSDTPVECIILRPPYVYGRNNYLERERFIFHHLVNDLPIYVPDDGMCKIQFIYHKDLANAVLSCIETSCGNVSIYNVGNKKSINFIEWIHACEKVCGKKAILHFVDTAQSGIKATEFFPFAAKDVILDTSAIYDIFHRELDFTLGLEDCYRWFKENEGVLLISEARLAGEKRCAAYLSEEK